MPALRARHEARLDELVELFLARGFRDLTVADIAAELHCSKSSLYAFGQSKEQVTVEAIKQFFKGATEDVEAATAGEASPSARLVAYLMAISQALRPASARFMADVAEQRSAREVYERNTESAAQRVRQIVADGVRAQEFRDVHAAFVADTVVSTMERIQTGSVIAATGLSDADAYEALAELVLDGIRTSPRGT
jgi:AcrR family transcriptional regulator